MFKTVFAADIGSKCIKCVARGQVAAEETAIALEAGAKLTVAAAGNAALLHRSGVIRPVRDGAAANTRMLAMLLGRLACEKTGKRTTASIELHAAIPHMLPTVKQNALKQAARLAGFRALQVHDPLLHSQTAECFGRGFRMRAARLWTGRFKIGSAMNTGC